MKNSYAISVNGALRASRKSASTPARSGTARSITSSFSGSLVSLSVASVTTPSVPSLPMKSWRRSAPVLFFSSAPFSSSTAPLASTTSSPSTQFRVRP